MHPCRLLRLLLLLLCLSSTEARFVPQSRSFSGRESSSQHLMRLAFLWPHGRRNDPNFIPWRPSVPSQRGRIGASFIGKTCVSSLYPGSPAAAKPALLDAGSYTALLRTTRQPDGGTLHTTPKSRAIMRARSSSSLPALPMRGGGRGDGFVWTETAHQIRIEVLVDPSVKASDVVFQLQGRQLKVSIRGHKPLLQGTLKGRVNTSECLWFLEPYAPPQQQTPAAKQLTIVIEKHRSSGGVSAAVTGRGAHWGAVFEETAAAEAAAAVYDPLPDSGDRQVDPFSDHRAPGAILAELALPASLLGALPHLQPDEGDLQEQQEHQEQREKYMLRQALGFLDAWAHARDPQTLKPLSMESPWQGRRGQKPGEERRLEAFGCPETLVHVQVEPLPDGVLLLFMAPEDSGSGISNNQQQHLQETQWPDGEGIELRLVFSDARSPTEDPRQLDQQLHIVALRRSVGAAALHPFGSQVYQHLQDAEHRIIRKLQQDIAAAASGACEAGLESAGLPQQQGQQDDALGRLIKLEQERLNPPASGLPQQTSSDGEGPREDDVRVVNAFPSLGPQQKKSSTSEGGTAHETPRALLQESQLPPSGQQAPCSIPHPKAADSQTRHETAMNREQGSPRLEPSEDAAATREQMGIKLLDLSAKTAAVPSFMTNWSPERRRSFQEDTANEAAIRLKEAGTPALHLRFTDIEMLLRQQLNCTQEEFREAWQGGYDRCERQQQQQMQHLQQTPNRWEGIGSQRQQSAVFYVQQLEERINGTDRPPIDTHEAAAQAAEAAAADPAAGEALAALGDDTQEAGLKRRAFYVDPFAGPSADLAPPGQMHDVPALEEVPRHRRYLLMDEKQRAEMRREVQQDLARFELLLSELEAQKDRSAWLLICEQYKDLLLGESYFLSLTIRLLERPPVARSAPPVKEKVLPFLSPGTEKQEAESSSAEWAAEERDRLRFVNRFVLSLYEDLGALLQANEATQLKKIKLLCMQAVQDITKLNEYAESMKPLFDRDFFAYLLTAIQEERRRIAAQGLNPDAVPSQWLLVLLVIQKGVTALFEKEIREDVLDLGFILIQQQPEVRRKFLELWIAKLPKCDWRQFKLLGLRLAERFNSGDYSQAAVSAYPWLPAAARQLGHDLEQLLPEWLIEGMLSDFDRHVMQTQLSSGKRSEMAPEAQSSERVIAGVWVS